MEADCMCSYRQVLCEVAGAVNSAIDPEAVLRLVAHDVTNVLEASGCALTLATSEKGFVHTSFYEDGDAPPQSPLGPPDGDTPRLLDAEWISDAGGPPDARGQYRELGAGEGSGFVLSVPLVLGGQAIGVVQVFTPQAREFSEEEVHFIGAAATLGARSLQTEASLYSKTPSPKRKEEQDGKGNHRAKNQGRLRDRVLGDGIAAPGCGSAAERLCLG